MDGEAGRTGKELKGTAETAREDKPLTSGWKKTTALGRDDRRMHARMGGKKEGADRRIDGLLQGRIGYKSVAINRKSNRRTK